ncbi:MAG TPA: hypothetical protein VF519_00885 [Mycobacteriales bacterium]|jgi:hypothetical protein
MDGRRALRVLAVLAGAAAGAAATPMLVAALPQPACHDLAVCTTREVTVWWLLVCAAAGALGAFGLLRVAAARYHRASR